MRKDITEEQVKARENYWRELISKTIAENLPGRDEVNPLFHSGLASGLTIAEACGIIQGQKITKRNDFTESLIHLANGLGISLTQLVANSDCE
jgi:hypothetical protein